MATVSALIDRARLEIGDRSRSFVTSATADGVSRRFETPHKPLAAAGLAVVVVTTGVSALLDSNAYTVDLDNGYIDLLVAPAAGATVQISGAAYRYFSDAAWSTFVTSALLQHTHGTAITVTTLDPVEDYLVSLLSVTAALYALMNDAAFDIDIATPEGIAIPRHQRFDQLMQMMLARQEQYNRLAAALNVGLNRIEMFDLRRVSRTTNRLVPIYETKEIEDVTLPQRVFVPIDMKGLKPVPGDVPAVLDITMRQGNHYELPLKFTFDLTGFTLFASVRRYPSSSRIRDFVVTVTDAAQGLVTLSLTSSDTHYLPPECFWSLDLQDSTGNERTYVAGRVEVGKARLALWAQR